MKKRIFKLLLALVAIATTAQAQVVLNDANFPDANFRAALASILRISEGDEITEAMIQKTNTLSVSSKSIADLTGIEHFTALTSLYCWSNQLTSLDVSGCTALTVLHCSSNQLTSLDVSGCTALTVLYCSSNQLTSLDVSGCTALEELDCSRNQLTSLDVSGCTALTGLDCSYNQLTSLDVSGCTALRDLWCGDNQLTSLDVSGCTALTRLECYYNQLTSLDVSGCTALTWLECYNNQLTSLDVSQNTALKWLECYNNQLTSLDVSQNTALKDLSCDSNQLTSLDVSQNTALTELRCSGNRLTSLDVSQNTALKVLFCSVNQLTTLDVSQNTALTKLWCFSNQLTSLDVSQNTALTTLRCFNNQIKGEAMDALVASLPTVTGGKFYVIDTKDENEGNVCTKAQVAVAKEKGWTVYDWADGSLWIYEGSMLLLNAENFPDANFRKVLASILKINAGDEITDAMIQQTTVLSVLSKSIADLTGIEHFTALTSLDCSGNQLTSLDVSKNTALKELRCYNNQLPSLDVSGCTALTELHCNSNQLTSLDVSGCTALTELHCNSNQLTSLDVSQNTALTYLKCSSNQIKGEAMDALVNSLPTVESGQFYVINTKDENESNVCTKAQVAVAKGKGWTVYDYWSYGNQREYEGSDPVAEKLLLNAANFPDANFRAALATILKISEGDEITAEKIAATTTLDVSKSWNTPAEEKIADLTGIEHFTALTTLRCESNKLTSLDVSGCTSLTELRCYDNQLTSLDVSGCTALRDLRCFGNQLSSLDVSQNTALTQLSCHSNQLTSLDVSQNTALTSLDCRVNQLISLDVSQNTALTELRCSDNQLTSLDVSGCTALKRLYCWSNQLPSLDVSGCTALRDLRCYSNQLPSLDVSGCTALSGLECYGNQLTSLDVSGCTALSNLNCYGNQIKGEAMDALVNSLPTVTYGVFCVINTKNENEGNVCTKAQVAMAKEKGWTVYDYNGRFVNRQEYEGSDPVAEDIDPVDEGDDVDFGGDLDDNSNLNGNVIGNIFYNIGDENGEYSSAEGCIVVKKSTSDENVDGTDIFGEEFKNNFTGIVFKVPAGNGTIKVNAETTGNMTLKVKVGNNAPVEMVLDGKLKATFPYNVSEPTYVYIYAGAASEAKGFGAPASEDATLKIYGIEFIRDNTPTDINSVDSGELTVDSWYTIDGKKLAGEPKEKGIYIRNGRKVVK